MIFIPFKKHAARKILLNRVITIKYSQEEKEKIEKMIKNYKTSYIMTDYKEMLGILDIDEFLSAVQIKEPKRNKLK